MSLSITTDQNLCWILTIMLFFYMIWSKITALRLADLLTLMCSRLPPINVAKIK